MRKNLYVLSFLLLTAFTIYGQSFDGKSLLCNFKFNNENRVKFTLRSTGINIGGYEGTSLIMENLTGNELYVDVKLIFVDFCGVSLTRNVRATLKPYAKVGGSTWMGGSEHHDYGPKCKKKKIYGSDFKSYIASLQLNIASIKDKSQASQSNGGGGNSSGSNNSGGSQNTSGNYGNNGNSGGGTSQNKSCTTPGFSLRENVDINCVTLEWSCASTVVNVMNEKTGEFKQVGENPICNFIIEYRKSGENTWRSTRAGGGIVTNFNLTKLDPCSKYEVRMSRDCGNGVVSAPSRTVVFNTKCPTINALKAENVTTNSAQISNGRSSFSSMMCQPPAYVRIVEYKSSTSYKWEEVYCNKGQICTLNALLPGTTYRVRARYKFGSDIYAGYSNEISFTTKGTAPTANKKYTPTQHTGGYKSSGTTKPSTSPTYRSTSGASLSVPKPVSPAYGATITGYYFEGFFWNSVQGAVGYELLLATNPKFTGAILYTSTTTSYTTSNWQKGNTYYWKVRAKGANGKYSSWSGMQKVTMK